MARNVLGRGRMVWKSVCVHARREVRRSRSSCVARHSRQTRAHSCCNRDFGASRRAGAAILERHECSEHNHGADCRQDDAAGVQARSVGSGPKITEEMKPPTNEPTRPSPSVIRQPRGWRPGTNNLPSEPAIKPTTIHHIKLSIRSSSTQGNKS
jgi:hypothetical protein